MELVALGATGDTFLGWCSSPYAECLPLDRPLSPLQALAAVGPISVAAVTPMALGLPILAMFLLYQAAQGAGAQGGSRG